MDATRPSTGSLPWDRASFDSGTDDPSRATMKRLQLCFATLSCLGGFVIAGVEETETLMLIAVFFALFGYIVVDWLEVFALPALLAYLAMGVVAIYCVASFWNLEAPGNSQMVSVANLLVMVQSILMLQKKTLRIFEQLTVFCILQLVVAAVFNDAISYGVLLIPICLIASAALGLMSSLSASESVESQGIRPLIHRPPPALASQVSISGREAFESSCRESDHLPRAVIFAIAPAVAMIGTIFFYALPRTSDSARNEDSGQTLVGFSDHLSLDQIGMMQQSGQLALRVRLRNHSEPKSPYRAKQEIYLRGRVLEKYDFGFQDKHPTSTVWMTSSGGSISSNLPLPNEYIPVEERETQFYDRVEVDVSCESIGTATLFAVTPYYALAEEKRIVHNIAQSTLSRKIKGDQRYPRLRYEFLTHGFHEGIQNRYLVQPSPQDSPMAAMNLQSVEDKSMRWDSLQGRDMLRANSLVHAVSTFDLAITLQPMLLQFDRRRIPTAKLIADRISSAMPEAARNPMKIAERLESHLSTSKQYAYTLKLDHPVVKRLDPIERFLAVDKAGHCQFFASSMVMMLRSQGIPARVVVGFRTEEYSDLGQYYTVRQLHAHAWVEALIHREYIKEKAAFCGQPSADQYWVRFDPTPSYSLSASAQPGGVSQVFDLAQNIWDDYVVDMDRQLQTNASGSQRGTLFASYGQLFSWIGMRIAAIRAGQLGGGSLAGRPAFSWSAAITTIAIGCGLFIVAQIPKRRRIRKPLAGLSTFEHQHPRFDFYQETLAQLARLGIERSFSQTPDELAMMAHDSVEHPERLTLRQSLDTLTSIYCRVRYGSDEGPAHDESTPQQTMMSLKEPQKSRAETALQGLRQRIDEIVANQQVTSPNQESKGNHR